MRTDNDWNHTVTSGWSVPIAEVNMTGRYAPVISSVWWDIHNPYVINYYGPHYPADFNCPWCGQYHINCLCPRVKALEYYPDGEIKRVEFHDGEEMEFADHKAAEINRPEILNDED